MRDPRRLRAGLVPACASLLGVLALISGQGCIHLVQPQTYYLDTARVRLQWDEYLNKELMAGLPEPLFRRWYTRTEAWKDDFRPYILDQREEDGRTVYNVGTGGRTLAQVYFKDGRLDEVGAWSLTQEAFLSAWLWNENRPSFEVDPAILERLEKLDPPSEVLIPEKHRDDGRICDFAEGTEVESISPLYLSHFGISKPSLSQRRKDRSASNVPVLPAGAELLIESWGVGTGRAVLPGPSGKGFRVDIDDGDHGLCPRGECAHVGDVGILSRDLTVATEEMGQCSRRAIAVASGQSRIPVWMERVGSVPAGARVRVLSWSPCKGLRPFPGANAEIEVLGEPGRSLPPRLSVLLAPPGFFRPLPAEGGSASARSLVE